VESEPFAGGEWWAKYGGRGREWLVVEQKTGAMRFERGKRR
jgi:hypothetical protein